MVAPWIKRRRRMAAAAQAAKAVPAVVPVAEPVKSEPAPPAPKTVKAPEKKVATKTGSSAPKKRGVAKKVTPKN